MEPITFLAGTLMGAGGAWAARRLSRAVTHSPKEGLGDLLGWAFLIDDGVLLMKDGSFLAGMSVRGRDLESATVQEVEQAAAAVHDALVMLGPGFSAEVNVHRRERREYPDDGTSHFPTRPLRMVEHERRELFTRPGEHYDTSNIFLLTYTPPKASVQRWERLMVQGGASGLDYARILGGFQRTMEEVRGTLATTFFVEALSSEALVTECHRCLTGLDDAVAVPREYLGRALASVDFTTGYVPQVGQQHVFVVTVSGLGAFTEAAAGDFFNSLRENARWHMRFVGLSRTEARSRIQKIETKWFSQRAGLRGLIAPEQSVRLEDRDAVAMQSETADAQAAIASGGLRFGYFSNTMYLRDHSLKRGQSRVQGLLQVLRDQGLTCSQETINAPDAFIGSLPGHAYANLRRPLLSSLNVAHLFPTTTPWPGARRCPNSLFPPDSPPLLYARACGATPFRLNLYQGQVGHTLVIGATGAGKSVLVGFIALSFLRYKNSRVFIFDVGRSHHILTRATGGIHHDPAAAGASALQPLRCIDLPEERMWAMDWLSTLYALNGRPLSAADKLKVDSALSLMAQGPRILRTLTALYIALPRDLQPVLEPYTVRGAFGRLLDGAADDVAVARTTTFELADVLALGNDIVVPLLLALFRQVERTLDGSPTLIIIEEAWAALMRSTFSERIRQWLLTLRKANAAVVIVAHSAGQLRDLPNASNVTESCPTRLILPNPEARVAEHAEVYRFLDLGAREIELVATAQRQREYYYKSPSGSRLFELTLGPFARALLMPLPGRSAQESAALVHAAIDRHGEAFLDFLPQHGESVSVGA